MNASTLTSHIWRARRGLPPGATPQQIYGRLLPAAQDVWDANELPDIWLGTNLYLLRKRLTQLERIPA